MEREGLVTKPLLKRYSTDAISINNNDDNSSGSGGGGGDDAPAKAASGATALLVLSTIVAASGSFSSGYAAGFSSPAESGIMAELGLSVAEYSVFGSILTIGGMIGAVISGRVADFFGRRITMWILNIFYIMGWLAIIFAKDAWSLDLGRLSLGFGIGLVSYVGNVYIAEISPKNLRGGFMAINPLLTGFSTAFVYLIGSIISWHILALIGCISCLVQILGVFFIPESPRWLVKNGREKEFEASLHRLRGEKVDISEEAADIKDYTENLKLMSEDKILDLFQRKYAHSIIVGIGLMVLQQFGGISGIQFYMSSIFELAGISTRVGFIVVAVVKILMNTLGLLLIDKLGRRSLLLVSATGTCLGTFLTGLSFFLQDLNWWEEMTPILALTGLLVYMGTFSLGMGGIPWIIVSEIFPINVKGSAGSICNLVNWFCAWVVSYTFSFLLEWSSAGTFFIFSSISCSGVLFIAKLVPETKGRTLEEIQASMTHGQ